jgi:hypothetical protein
MTPEAFAESVRLVERMRYLLGERDRRFVAKRVAMPPGAERDAFDREHMANTAKARRELAGMEKAIAVGPS